MEPENDIHFENELKKLKLQAEKGMHFMGQVGEGEVPPEVMRDFLSHIEAFENGLQNASYTTVGAYLGNPAWKPESEIPESEIAAALDELHRQLAAKDIQLNLLYPTPDRIIYRFITEELIHKEIEDMQIPGMTTNYIYEEFHPNHRQEVRKRCREFIDFFFDVSKDEFGDLYLADGMKADMGWQHFREAFDRFSLVKCKATDFQLENGRATVTMEISFTGHLKGVSEGVRFAGTGKLGLLGDDDGWWQIAHMQLPGQVT